MNRYRFAAFALVVTLVSAAALACSGDTVVNSTTAIAAGITVDGTGKASGAPDTVFLTVGVNVQDSTVAAARETAASAMQGVINSLKSNGVAEKDIQTTQFNISPQYDYDGRTQILRGYQVSNVVTAKITKIDTAGKVIDDAAAAGGNNAVVQSIRFTIDDTTKLQTTARVEAMKHAQARADELAKNAGVDLGAPISISETYQSSQPPIFSPVAAPRTGAADSATPIQAGELEVVVNLTVLYGIR